MEDSPWVAARALDRLAVAVRGRVPRGLDGGSGDRFLCCWVPTFSPENTSAPSGTCTYPFARRWASEAIAESLFNLPDAGRSAKESRRRAIDDAD